jgi:hypothetical protein
MPLLIGAVANDCTGASDLANTLHRNGLYTIQTIGVPASGFDVDDPHFDAFGRREPACGRALPPLTAYYVMRVGRLPLAPYFPPGDESLAAETAPVQRRAMALAAAFPIAALTEASSPKPSNPSLALQLNDGVRQQGRQFA